MCVGIWDCEADEIMNLFKGVGKIVSSHDIKQASVEALQQVVNLKLGLTVNSIPTCYITCG